jgi:hypothetical protein
MNRPDNLRIFIHAELVAFALLGLACGPPKLAGDADDDADDESSNGESSELSETSSSSSSSSETGTDGTSTSETDTNETLETGFVIPEDVGMWTEECDSFAQDCPDGEKCVPYSSSGGTWDALKCVPVLGTQAAGEPCTYAGTVESTDDCDATSFCLDINQEEMGTCLPFCSGTADMPECPPSSSCSISGAGVVNLCIPSCDPILQDCNGGLACYWANTDFSCIFTTSDIPPGEPCGFINDCVAGTSCMTADVLPSCVGAACCTPWCQLGAGDQVCDAVPGTSCVPFFEQDMAPPGYEHVGVCLVPP